MKKIIFTMLMAVLVLATAQARDERRDNNNTVSTEQTAENASEQEQVSVQQADEDESDTADKVTITKNGLIVKDRNGNVVEISTGDLSRIINEHLDDTVLSITQDEGIEINSENVNAMAQRGMDLAEDISRAFFAALVAIVFLSLLFYFLHRRRKYKTIDRAIQAGYPLPDEFFGKRSQHVPQQPTNVYVTQVTPPDTDTNQAAPGSVPPSYGQSSNPLNNITDWTPFKKGIKITAWGLGLLFFFWILGAQPIAALMVIVVFIGLGKLFITYQEQQNLKNQWQQQQWTQQPQQPQQQWTQQPQQQWQQYPPQQPPHNVPPVPETPPEFNQNR